MTNRIADSRSGPELKFFRATMVFAVALALHAADHFRRGMDVIPPAVMMAGNIQIVAAALTLALVLRRNRWAPHAAVTLGLTSAVGFGAAHLLPRWGPLSDSFINPVAGSGVTWFSWVTAVGEIGSALVMATAGIAFLRAASPRRSVA
ncbi:hypothetical protein [Mycobacterium asiaticum]|uniref:hypothetical protein n=1 Tax=Mycobacterium asiaticum TaxID=1790 RepID=UPI000A573222|nr:hypothetical protein [Mycobacterium asiaticum]